MKLTQKGKNLHKKVKTYKKVKPTQKGKYLHKKVKPTQQGKNLQKGKYLHKVKTYKKVNTYTR